jgi:hypothetical protein
MFLFSLLYSIPNKKHENKPPSEEWLNSPYLAREAQGMLL